MKRTRAKLWLEGLRRPWGHLPSLPEDPSSRRWETPILHRAPLMGSVLILAFILGTICVYLYYVIEPRFQEKTARELLQDLQCLDPPVQAAAQASLRQAGRAALPAIIESLKVRDTELKSKCLELESKQSLFKLPFRNAAETRAQAFEACRLLGPQAQEVLPLLQKLIDRDPGAVGVMGALGPAAVYPISQLLDHPNRSVRLNAIEALGNFRTYPFKALPILLQALNQKEPEIKFFTVKALGALGAEPERTIPALVSCLSDSGPSIRRIAADAIGKYGAAGKPAIPALLRNLHDPSQNVRRATAMALSQVDRPTAVKALNEIVFHDLSGDWAVRVLLKLAPEGPGILLSAVTNVVPQIRARGFLSLSLMPAGGEDSISRLIEGLRDRESTVRKNAAKALVAHGIAPRAATPLLASLLEEEDPELKYWALNVLRYAGVEGQAAAPAVRCLLDNPNPTIRNMSAVVLKALDRPAPPPRARPIEVAEWPAFREGVGPIGMQRTWTRVAY